MDVIGILIILFVFICFLTFCRSIVMWWLGTNEIAKHLKEMQTDQKQIIELLQEIADQSVNPQSLPVVQSLAQQGNPPTPNPLTNRPALSQNPQNGNKNNFYR